MNELITFIMDNGVVVVGFLTALVTLASAIANFTESDADNKVVAVLGKVVDFLALNWKK